MSVAHPSLHTAVHAVQDLNAAEPVELAWVAELLRLLGRSGRDSHAPECDASGLGRYHRPPRNAEHRREPAPARLSRDDVLAVSRALGALPRAPWPYCQFLRCAYLPGYPRPAVACRLWHIQAASWVRVRNEALGLLAEVLRRDAPALARSLAHPMDVHDNSGTRAQGAETVTDSESPLAP